MKRGLYWLGALLSLACAWFFARALGRHWDAVGSIPWGGRVLLASALALLLYMSTYVIAAGVWQRCLHALGAELSYGRAAMVLMISQLAKYLPGNVGHHLGRVALARNAGIPMDLAVASVLVETLLVVIAGATCSLPAVELLLRVGSERFVRPGQALPATLVSLIVAGAIVFAGGAVYFWRRNFGSRPLRLAKMGRSLALAWAGLCLSFALGGTALYLICDALSATQASWIAVVGVYAAAWLLGFLVPGSPAGLGVREFALLLGLGPIYGASSAAMAAALLRLVTVTGDGLVFLSATVLGTRTSQRA